MTNRYKVLALLLVLFPMQTVLGQPKGPQPWWPVQPKRLPFVHSLFTDDMVLQRDMAAPIWGWSEPGDKIAVSVDGKPSGQPAIAGKDGKWLAKVGPFTAGGPHTVAIAGGKQQSTLKNVLFGDVWLCSGQSNMNWPVRLSLNAVEEVKQADHPQIRSFTVSFYPSLVSMKLPPAAQWEVCKPEFAKNFTGVGYFFAREIHKTQKIPIGIIHSSAGATYGEVWVSPDALRKHMPNDFKKEFAALKDVAGENAETYDYFTAIEKWTGVVDPPSARLKYASDLDLKTDDWRDIAVPKPWQDAGIPDFNGLVWFRHWIDVPKDWAGKDLKLNLSVINDTDVVWFNGMLIGCKQIKGSPRSYIVEGSLVKPGKNLLAALVVNSDGPGGFVSAPANMTVVPVDAGKEKPIRLAGTWKAKATVPSKDIAVVLPTLKVGHYQTMCGIYQGMIAPLEPSGIKGALWYQGEANGPRWLQYRRLLPTLITDWRERFPSSADKGNFPFLIVALPNYNPLQRKPIEPGWAEIRESQWRTVRSVPNTGLATTIDIGDANDIHPRNKQEVGRRLALTARNLVYGEKQLVYSGPEFTEMKIEPKKDRVRLYFKHVGGGLMLKPGDKKLTGFVIAGADKNFAFADAVIDGDTIVVSSPEVPEPRHVRYGWAWNPIVNLYNRDGLPAITFRTDE
ncbi:MAG: 9-O-acetylesterase [Gemmataceae bacterium]|nr:9-O-acetylesterase [Gemmataceae bacterium]